ncbi:MAG: glycosyltransferase family 2 protein, partial [Burkholderiales bacterium]
MSTPSRTHLIVIPSYNTGGGVLQTVWDARQIWQPVWVVVDGSTDGTLDALQALARDDPNIRVLALPRNRGKGAAILHGLRAAEAAGYTHALTMDADGQHPTGKIREFMAASAANPEALILGLPVFDASAPRVRVHGRKLSNWCAKL